MYDRNTWTLDLSVDWGYRGPFSDIQLHLTNEIKDGEMSNRILMRLINKMLITVIVIILIEYFY